MSKNKNFDMNDELKKFDDYEILDEEYNVEKILDKKKYKGIWKYKIKWEGYSLNECTWEPIENLKQVMDMVIAFDANYSKNKTKKLNETTLTTSVSELSRDLNNKTQDDVQSLTTTNETNSEIATIQTEMIEETEGDFQTHKAKRIAEAQIISTNPVEFKCLVEWETKNGSTQLPKPKWYSSNIIKEKDPNILFEFYERNIKFPK